MSKKIILMDIDGTVCVGNEAIPGAVDAVERLKKIGLRIVYFTNNSTTMKEGLVNRLRNAGFDCREDDVISSGTMAVGYVKEHGYDNVYVFGTESLREEFRKNGIGVVDAEHADTLVIGMDADFDYDKIRLAVNAALRSKHIIVCNEDRLFACKQGICPGCGAMVSSILFCSEREPDVIVGKPGPIMLDFVKRSLSVSNEEILIVGDSFNSDILMGMEHGVDSVLIGDDDRAACKIKRISDLPAYVEDLI